MRNGSVEFFNLATSILSTFVPAASLPNTGFAFKDYDAVWQAMDGGLGEYVRAEIGKTPITTISKVWDNGFRQITSSTREIRKPEDLKGFKIRVPPAPMLTSLFKALDAGAAPINFNELYSSLQTKVVEGEENPLPIIATTRLYEVQKTCSMTGHVWDGYWILGNKRAWQRLPEDLRGIVSREFDRSAADQRADVAKLSVSLRQTLTEKGIGFIDVDRTLFRDALSKTTYYKDWKAKFGEPAGATSNPSPASWSEGDGHGDRHRGGRGLPGLGLDGPPLRARGWLTRLDTAIGWLVEIPAALLVLAEIGVLLSGVVSRYVFHEPLIWSDELAGILFLWLAMLGAVVAFRRAEHMRMTALVAMAGTRTRAFLETLALVAGLVFVSLVLHPAYEFASEEVFVQTPALELNNAWRAAALPVGFGLMLLIALIRLAETADWKVTLAALATGGPWPGRWWPCSRSCRGSATSTCCCSSSSASGCWSSPACPSPSPSASRPSPT